MLDGTPVDKPTLNLTYEDFEQMSNAPYDPMWIRLYNVHPTIIQSFSSNQTFERMVNNKIIDEGDEIYHVGAYDNGGVTVQVEKVAKVCSVLASMDVEADSTNLQLHELARNEKGFNYRRASITSGGVYQCDLLHCRSAGYIVKAFNEIEPRGSLRVFTSFHDLKIRRGDVELCSLQDVRQAWHLWEQVMDLMAKKQNVKYRQTRTKPVKPAFYDQIIDFGGVARPSAQHTGQAPEPPNGQTAMQWSGSTHDPEDLAATAHVSKLQAVEVQEMTQMAPSAQYADQAFQPFDAQTEVQWDDWTYGPENLATTYGMAEQAGEALTDQEMRFGEATLSHEVPAYRWANGFGVYGPVDGL